MKYVSIACFLIVKSLFYKDFFSAFLALTQILTSKPGAKYLFTGWNIQQTNPWSISYFSRNGNFGHSFLHRCLKKLSLFNSASLDVTNSLTPNTNGWVQSNHTTTYVLTYSLTYLLHWFSLPRTAHNVFPLSPKSIVFYVMYNYKPQGGQKESQRWDHMKKNEERIIERASLEGI